MQPYETEDEPWYPEDTVLGENDVIIPNYPLHGGSMRERIAVTFAFVRKGNIVVLDRQTIQTQNFAGIDLLAAIAPSFGPSGRLAHALWFGEGGTKWKWMRISDIEEIVVQTAHLFRLGVVTKQACYFMTIPHPDYQAAWYETLANMDSERIDIKVWPLGGRRPIWWLDEYKNQWPFDKSDPVHRVESHECMLDFRFVRIGGVAGVLWEPGELAFRRLIGENGKIRHCTCPKRYWRHVKEA
ncbi:hypothetical protein FRC11_000826, partial [Ceratobasidium sp. 423]